MCVFSHAELDLTPSVNMPTDKLCDSAWRRVEPRFFLEGGKAKQVLITLSMS